MTRFFWLLIVTFLIGCGSEHKTQNNAPLNVEPRLQYQSDAGHLVVEFNKNRAFNVSGATLKKTELDGALLFEFLSAHLVELFPAKASGGGPYWFWYSYQDEVDASAVATFTPGASLTENQAELQRRAEAIASTSTWVDYELAPNEVDACDRVFKRYVTQLCAR